jgi:hypothetical protein
MIANYTIVFNRAVRIQYHILTDLGIRIYRLPGHQSHTATQECRPRHHGTRMNSANHVKPKVQQTMKTFLSMSVVADTANADESETHALLEQLWKQFVAS